MLQITADVGLIAGLSLVAGAVVGLTSSLCALRRRRERRDALVAAQQARLIAQRMDDAAYWFGPSDGPASLVLREIARDMDDNGVFDVARVRERCRAVAAKESRRA